MTPRGPPLSPPRQSRLRKGSPTGEAEAHLPRTGAPTPTGTESPESPAHSRAPLTFLLLSVSNTTARAGLEARRLGPEPGCAGTGAPEMTFLDSGNVAQVAMAARER